MTTPHWLLHLMLGIQDPLLVYQYTLIVILKEMRSLQSHYKSHHYMVAECQLVPRELLLELSVIVMVNIIVLYCIKNRLNYCHMSNGCGQL